MEKIKNIFIPTHVLVIFAITAFFFTGSFLFSFNPLLPLFAGGSLLILSLFLQAPLVLLAFLIVVRMSLDYSSQYLTLSLYEQSFTLSQLIGLGIALLGTILIVQKRKEVLHYPVFWPLALIFAWGASTVPYSVSSGSTLAELVRIFGLFSIGFMAYIFTKRSSDYKFLLHAIILSALLPILLGLYQFFFGIGFVDADVSVARIFGTFSHPNIFSLYLFSLLVVTVLYFLLPGIQHDTKRKKYAYFLLAVFSLLLLLTFTRVAWITAFIFGATLLFARSKMTLIPAILLPLVLYFASPTFQDRVQESLSPDPDSSIVWRQNLWHDTILKTTQDDRRIIGFGMSTFPLVSETLRGENVGSHDPHNDFVRFFVEGGYIGLLVYVVYILSVFIILASHFFKRSGWKKQSFFILALFWFCLCLAALSDNIFKNTPVEWIFFILTGSLLKLATKK